MCCWSTGRAPPSDLKQPGNISVSHGTNTSPAQHTPPSQAGLVANQNLIGPHPVTLNSLGVSVHCVGHSESPVSILHPFWEPLSATLDLGQHSNHHSAEESSSNADSHHQPRKKLRLCIQLSQRNTVNDKIPEQYAISNIQPIPNEARRHGHTRMCKSNT